MGLLGLNGSGIDEKLNQRLILGELFYLVTANQVGARVPYLGDVSRCVVHHDRGQDDLEEDILTDPVCGLNM
jgi:hypothetical protein